MKNVKLLLTRARPGPGNVITHPHVGVAGAHGTNARGRCERAGELSRIFGFQKRERHKDRAREILLSKKPVAFYEIGSSIGVDAS